MTHETCWVGVDVSKATLAVYPSCSEPALSVSNDPEGLQRLIAILRPESPRLIVLEATGGLERAVVAELLVANLPVAVINPRQARHVAAAIG